MTQRVFRFLWLSILAMVLPSQALAYLSQTEQELNTRFANGHASKFSAIELDGLFTQLNNPTENSTAPSTESESSSFSLGILNLQRHFWFSRNIEDEEPPAGDSLSQFVDVAAQYYLYQPANSNLNYWVGNRLTQTHRISGWKESNALYVALNSQFPFSS